jgi:hypothetical protein
MMMSFICICRCIIELRFCFSFSRRKGHSGEGRTEGGRDREWLCGRHLLLLWVLGSGWKRVLNQWAFLLRRARLGPRAERGESSTRKLTQRQGCPLLEQHHQLLRLSGLSCNQLLWRIKIL